MNANDIITPVRKGLGIAAIVIALACLAKLSGFVAIRVDFMPMVATGILCALVGK